MKFQNIFFINTLLSFSFILPISLYAQQATESAVKSLPETKTEKNIKKKRRKTESGKKTNEVFTIGEIVVRDNAIANIEDATTTTEITSEDIKARGEKVLSESLSMVPGVQIARHRKGNKQFYLRGYDMQKVALLVDGIPITDAYGGNMDIDNIGVAGVSKIIVNRGVSSALYGTRGVVGSINIITRKPEKLTAEASAEYGFLGQYNCNVQVGMPVKLPLGKLYFWLNGSYDRSEGYKVSSRLTKSERERWVWLLSRYDLNGFNFNDLYNTNSAIQSYINDTGTWDHVEHNKYKISGKLGYEISKDLETGISGGYNYTEKKGSTYFSSMTSAYNEETGTWANPLASDALGNMSTHWPDYYDFTVSPYIRYKRKNFNLKANGFFYQQSNNLAAYKDVNETTLKWGTPETAAWSIWASQSYGVNFFPTYKFAKWNKLNSALSLRFDNHKKEEEAMNEGATKILAVFGNSRYETQFIEALTLTMALEEEMNFFQKKLQISLGVSYDMQHLMTFRKRSKTGEDGTVYTAEDTMIDQYLAADDSLLFGTRDAFNPVIGIIHEPYKDFLKFRTAGSLKTSFPTLEVYSKTGQYADVTGKGSMDVKINSEKSYNANTGVELTLLEGILSIRGDYFFSSYRDKIERIYDKSIDDHRYVNVDSAMTHGLETIFKGEFKDIGKIVDISFSLSYTFTHARNTSGSHNTDINMGEKFEETPEHQLIADLRFNFITGTKVSLFGHMTFNEIQYTMNSIPAADDSFSTEYFYEQKLHNPIILNFQVSQSLLNHMELYLLCKNMLDDYSSDPLNPGPGITFYLGIKGQY